MPKAIESQDKIGSAVRYKSPKRGWFSRSSGRKLYIEPVALEYINSLNGYDQSQVCKGIENLSSISSPDDVLVSKQRPAHFKAAKATSAVFNFLIKYQVASDSVIVSNVILNSFVLGEQKVRSTERPCLYNVKRLNDDVKFSSHSSLEDVERLSASWQVGPPIENVRTKYAAVNGMLSELGKGSWLMGAHLDTAYSNDKFNDYTLFHNPSESLLLDLYESAKDKLGLTTEVAKQLAAVLADVQVKGRPVKWVVHSQGGILFKQAVAYHLKKGAGQRLDKNSVVFHAGGNNKAATEKLLAQVGIKKEGPDRNNPFDGVPNIVGANDLSLKSIKNSLQFFGKVKGSDTSNPAESPHTLPFFSLEAYHRFLTLAGDAKSAGRVQKKIEALQ